MTVVVALPLVSPPALPATFVERWRQLEAEHGEREQTLEAHEVLDAAGAGWWVVLRVGARVVSSTHCDSPAAAAEKAFRIWRAAMAKRNETPTTKNWQDSGKGFRRLVDVSA